ncbi:MAG: ATP-binding protein [Campylobacterota bacterium]|nr:ATP-binding protein [Campylobacterota bacterium]
MLKDILVEQNLHWADKQKNYIKREMLDKLISYLPLRQIITITGIRRCGKSTLAKEAINHLIESGTDAKNILFVNLEHPYFLEFRNDPSYLGVIYEAYLKLFNPDGKIYVIFDEIQYFDQWQVYIKSKYESSDIKYIITGSNSSMLSNELNTLLSGRSLNIHLDTFSFTEFLDFKNIAYSSELERISNKIVIYKAKEEYLQWGGFYEVMEIEDESIKKDILLGYAKNIIYQDIVPRYNIRNSEVVERLFFYLLSTVTGQLNYSTLAGMFDVSDKTIKEYINHFEDVFLLKRIDRFHNKPKERIKSSKKIYALDNGLIQIAPKNSKNLGNALENWVFTVLNAKENDLYYLKDGKEIDFYEDGILYQVSYAIDNEKTKKREIEAFLNFSDISNNYCLITFDTSEEIDGVDVETIDDFLFSLCMESSNE